MGVKRIALIACITFIAGGFVSCGGGGGGGGTTGGGTTATTTLTHAESKPASQKSIAMSRQLISVMGVEDSGGIVTGRAAGRAFAARTAGSTTTYTNQTESDTGCTLNGYITITQTTSTTYSITGQITRSSCTSTYMDGAYQYNGTATQQSSTAVYFDTTTTFVQQSTSLTMTIAQKGTYNPQTDVFTPAAGGSVTVNGTDPKNFTYTNLVITQTTGGGYTIAGKVTDSSSVATTYANSSCDSNANYSLKYTTNAGISGSVTMSGDGSGSAVITQTSNGASVMTVSWSASGAGTITYADGASESFTDCAYTCCSNSNCSSSTPICTNACTSTAACVQCTTNSHCSTGYTCSSNVCVLTSAVLSGLAADAVLDSSRGMMYVSDKTNKKVYAVAVPSMQLQKTFTFSYMPERMEISPDGSKLYVALLTREHSSGWYDEDGHTGYISEIDLATNTATREIFVDEDPYDIVITSTKIIVSSGSGQWTKIKAYNLTTGSYLGAATIRQQSRLFLHPNQQWVYAANTDSSPSDIEKFDISGSAVTALYDSPYHGDYRMNGNVYVFPDGNSLLTRGGDVFNSTSVRSTDMTFIRTMTATNISHLAFDSTASRIYSLEGSSLKYYNLSNQSAAGSYTLDAAGSFVAVDGSYVYVVKVQTSTTEISKIAKSAL